jgi:hypothetical protein
MRTVFDGMAKPNPCEPPVVEAITVLIQSLHPEIDQRTATVARINCRIGLQQISESIAAIRRPLELMIPSVTVSSNPSGLPIARTKSPGCTMSSQQA